MMERSGGQRLQDAARGDKRALILAEAVRLFNRQGYADTRLEDVAARLDTAKTSISYHFKSKEALLAEAYMANCSFAEAILTEGDAQESGVEKVSAWLRNMARAYAQIVSGTREPFAAISDLAALSPQDRILTSERMQAIASDLAGFLERGVLDKTVCVQSVPATALFLLNAPQWMAPWLANVPADRRDEAIGTLLDTVQNGLLVDPDATILSPTDGGEIGNSDFLFDRDARNKMKVQAFLRAGTRHLNRVGFTNLSLNGVAGELGVTRGSFYYYIDDKDALLAGCADRTLGLIEQAFEQHGKRAPAGAALFQVAGALYRGHINDLDPLLRLPLLYSLPDSERRLANARLTRIRANFDEILAKGMADGSIRSNGIEGIGDIILGAIYGATPQRLQSFGLANSGSGTAGISPAAFFQPLANGISRS